MRECTSCGRTYHRVNKLATWAKRNPGSNKGWLKTELKLCNDCFSVREALRMLNTHGLKQLARRLTG